MCLLYVLVVLSGDWILQQQSNVRAFPECGQHRKAAYERVVFFGIVTVLHLLDARARTNAGASSLPDAFKVQVPCATSTLSQPAASRLTTSWGRIARVMTE